MELSQSVNATNEERDFLAPAGGLGSPIKAEGLGAVTQPCLYIGDAGQRCSRLALANGFCSKHRPNAPDTHETSESTIVKRAFAVIGVLAALWPLIADLLRELLRHLR